MKRGNGKLLRLSEGDFCVIETRLQNIEIFMCLSNECFSEENQELLIDVGFLIQVDLLTILAVE